MKRALLAALMSVALTTFAHAEETVAAAPSAPALAAAPADPAAPAADPAAVVAPQAPAATPPSDPMELVAFARTLAAEPGRCRFAFTQANSVTAQSGLADAAVEAVIRFDPRKPLGERFTLISATRQERAIRRNLVRQDRMGLPTDLIALMAEGEYTFERLQHAESLADREVYSFAPKIVPGRGANETGVKIVEQLVGRLEVSRETGRVIRVTLREPQDEAVRALMIVRLRSAMLSKGFGDPAAQGFNIADSGSQMLDMSALLSSTATTTASRYTEIEPVCDEAEVARIGAMEAAAAAARAR